jgi:hypothetical protein
MEMIKKYFGTSIIVAVVGVLLGGALGWLNGGTVAAMLETMFIVGILGVLETSLSFDNAVVNATVLKDMDDTWRHRFLTWGMLIAVFGMRVIFPVVIVSILGHINPIEAFTLALSNPHKYSHILETSHVMLSGFGGAFLLMVALKYFLEEKDLYWIQTLEEPLAKLGKLDTIEIAITLLALAGMSTLLGAAGTGFLMAGAMGIVTHIGVDAIGSLLEASEEATMAVKKGLSAFLYLEVLDASFSFDGVIGAFALSNNIFVIAIGLGIGAMFVRSLTLMLVDKGTLTEFPYLEHGAFWAILALAGIMFVSTMVAIPEAVTGLLGAGFIGLALYSSIKYNNEQKALENTKS